jgi:type II secretory pathway component GspD/PulD (secretin)
MTRAVVSMAAIVACLTYAGAASADEPRASAESIFLEATIAEFDGPPPQTDWDSADDPAKRITELEAQGKVSLMTRISLATLDGREAKAQFGQRVAVVSGRVRTGRGGEFPGAVSNQFVMDQVGTVLSFMPVLADDGSIIVELTVEKSRLAPAEPPAASASEDGFIPPRTITISLQTSVRVPPGKTVAVGGYRSSTAPDATHALVFVRAAVEK